jgi:DNA-binding MarR family transcriptional regulator
MSTRKNLPGLLHDPWIAINERVDQRLADHGHTHVRPAHSNVFIWLDDDGTRVSVLAERARMTKQSMGELVAHLESHGYVERVPDPSDRRAKLVRATASGEALYPIARAAIAEIEDGWARHLGDAKMRRLRELLEELDDAPG